MNTLDKLVNLDDLEVCELLKTIATEEQKSLVEALDFVLGLGITEYYKSKE